jgi:GNAT superfamily N-acetyltransferase
MIARCEENDFEAIYSIINDAAQAYRGIIPADRWQDPYMPREELQREIDDGIVFFGYKEDDELLGVMGIQDKQDVTLIRHAYVRTHRRKQGIGGRLLAHLEQQTTHPILIGTWSDAVWAIDFYQKHGYRRVTPEEKDRLLRTYWTIPERQVETSVVLASRKWFEP